MAALQWPTETSLWFVDVQMNQREARLADEDGIGAVLRSFLIGDAALAATDSEQILRDCLAHLAATHAPTLERDRVRAHLAVLLAETGATAAAEAEAAQLGKAPASAAFVDGFRHAYLGAAARPRDVDEAIEILDGGWASHRLFARLTRSAGQEWDAIGAEVSLLEEGRRLDRYALLVSGASFALAMLGSWWVLRALIRGRAAAPDDVAPLPPLHGGVSIGVRALWWGVVLSTATAAVMLYWPENGPSLDMVWAWYSLLVHLPVILILAQDDAGEVRREILDMLRLGPSARRVHPKIKAGASLFALQYGLIAAMTAAMEAAGIRIHWADGLNDDVLGAGATLQALQMVDMVLWAPVLEEIVFRGLLFVPVYHRYGFWAGVAFSSTAFTASHLYQLPNLTIIAVESVAFAFAVVRTGSLVPAVIAHSLHNLWSGLYLLLYEYPAA